MVHIVSYCIVLYLFGTPSAFVAGFELQSCRIHRSIEPVVVLCRDVASDLVTPPPCACDTLPPSIYAGDAFVPSVPTEISKSFFFENGSASRHELGVVTTPVSRKTIVVCATRRHESVWHGTCSDRLWEGVGRLESRLRSRFKTSLRVMWALWSTPRAELGANGVMSSCSCICAAGRSQGGCASQSSASQMFDRSWPPAPSAVGRPAGPVPGRSPASPVLTNHTPHRKRSNPKSSF